MRKLYLFNPDSDLALANNNENYMPPEPARKIGADLALLPIWYADASALVLAPSHPHAAYFQELAAKLDFCVELVSYPEIDKLCTCKAYPWGWNLATRKQLIELGVQEKGLQSQNDIQKIRQLTHRKTSSKLLSLLPSHPLVCGVSEDVNSTEDLKSLAQQLTNFLLKAPISGSGKGLKWCRNGLDQASMKWFANTVEKQGSVLVEPIYSKVCDFAMEFELLSPAEIRFIGYSSFVTNANGAYLGNQLLSDAALEQQLEDEFFVTGFLDQIRQELQGHILEIYGKDYQGYLGVDMMVCQDNETSKFQLHPCVEVNLRMNMGIVAHSVFNRYVQADKRGAYRINYTKKEGLLYQQHLQMQAQHPLQISQGNKIVSGYLALCPVTPQSQYHAWILIE